MRMEELSNNRFIKTPDTVEKYLLELIQTYFKNQNKASEESREYIIQKAIDRMKEELSLDGMGVLSVTINGEERVGSVTITLEDLNGEPFIAEKKTAFNVDFGNEQGTACEGNDPRLSDARKPLVHEHELSDIIGLEGIISTLNGQMQRINGLAHTHDNKDVLDKLVYSGDKKQIDLTLLDNLKDTVSSTASDIREEIIQFKEDINIKIKDAESNVQDTDKIINDLKQYIVDTNNDYRTQSNEYTDTKINEVKEQYNKALDSLIDKSELKTLTDLVGQSMIFLDTFSFRVSDIIDMTVTSEYRSGEYEIPGEVIDRITDKGLSENDYIMEILIYFINESGKFVYAPVPYIVFDNGIVSGSLNAGYDTTKVFVEYSSVNKIVPDNLQSAIIICNIYSKQGVAI